MEITIEHSGKMHTPKDEEIEINGGTVNITDKFLERTSYDGYGITVHFKYKPKKPRLNRAERRRDKNEY